MKKITPHLKEHELSAQQWRVLRALMDNREAGQEEAEMSAVADKCNLLLPSLSRIIQYLERRGLIERRTAEKDMRRSMICLSDEGVRLVELMTPQSEARYENITKVFGYGKLELLCELLDELTNKLSEDEPDYVLSEESKA